MENPAEMLETSRARGFTFTPGIGNGQQRSRFRESEEFDEAIGFTYVANAKSSGRGVIGQVQAELWYHSALRTIDLGSRRAGRESGIQRIVTGPRIETENFIMLEDNLRYIALSALRAALMRVRPNGFHN